jgi:hypothetical protein
MVLFRSATGEAWQDIMLDCSNQEYVLCDLLSDTPWKNESFPLLVRNNCGNDIAYPYFISFYVLCSFLVSFFIFYYSTLSTTFNPFHLIRLSIYSLLSLWTILII